MQTSFPKPASRNRRHFRLQPLIRVVGIVGCVLCSIVLPFFLMDELSCTFYQERSGTSVFMNAVHFYSSYDDSKKAQGAPDRYIAIVTYIGLPEDTDSQYLKCSVDEVIRQHVAPAFEEKGLHLDYSTNQMTNTRLYYYKENKEGGELDVRVYCIVTSRAAFAVVLV